MTNSDMTTGTDFNDDEVPGLATPIEKLTADLKSAGKTLSSQEARFLVDSYYMMQDNRKRTAMQKTALAKNNEPAALLEWLTEQNKALENSIKISLDVFSLSRPEGRWARDVMGVGPITTAGLLAYIDINKAETVSSIWRYAGLDPTIIWGKGQVRPYNATLKTICAFKIGEGFVKTSNKPKSYYGKIYATRKRLEWKRNLEGGFAKDAENILAAKKFDKKTITYKFYSGQFSQALIGSYLAAGESIPQDLKPDLEGKTPWPMLPPAHIHARARRYAVKLFLAHFHEISYRLAFGKPPPLPYPIVHLEGHNDIIAVPFLPPELQDAEKLGME